MRQNTFLKSEGKQDAAFIGSYLLDFYKNHKNSVDCGFTLVELIIIVAILGSLSAIGVPNYLKYKEKAMVISAISELRIITRSIDVYMADVGKFPDSLSEIRTEYIDPWGNPYQYVNIKEAEMNGSESEKNGEKAGAPVVTGGVIAEVRKDRKEVPVNSDYDLYSMGKDGKSIPSFSAKDSQDDVVRANNGRFYGLVSDY